MNFVFAFMWLFIGISFLYEGKVTEALICFVAASLMSGLARIIREIEK